VLDQVDERGLGPLQVVDHDDLRALRRTCFEQTPERELRLLRRDPDHLTGVDADRDEDLDERPVGDVVAVVEAASAEDVRLTSDTFEEVLDEPRFPDSGRPEEREQPAASLGDRVFEVAAKPFLLAYATDERRLQMTRQGVGVRAHPEQAIRLDRRGLPLEGERLDGLDEDRVPNEAPCLGADERFSRRSRLLEPSCDVDRVADGERLVLSAHDHLPGVHADPCLEPVSRDGLANLGGRADGAERVVLVRGRNPEDGHDRVADELLDDPSVTLDDRTEIVEVASHPRTERLGIGRLAERGGADNVGEENRHDLSNLARRRRLELGSAGVAVPRALGIRASTARARRHARSLGGPCRRTRDPAERGPGVRGRVATLARAGWGGSRTSPDVSSERPRTRSVRAFGPLLFRATGIPGDGDSGLAHHQSSPPSSSSPLPPCSGPSSSSSSSSCFTTICFVVVLALPLGSVTRSVTVYVPAAPKRCFTLIPVASYVPLLVKSHSNRSALSGDCSSLEQLPSNWTCVFLLGFLGEDLKHGVGPLSSTTPTMTRAIEVPPFPSEAL
jgi:hypothetical protein